MNLASYELTDNDYLKSIWVALRRVEELLATPASAPPPPSVFVSAPDLSEIVTAVTGLRPSVTAEEIARALGDVLHFPEPENANAALSEVAEALKKLEFRMKGMGTQAYGGGAVTLETGSSPLPISGTVEVTNDVGSPLPISGTVVTGGLTDTQLRATPVPVSGAVSDTQLRASPVPISGTVVTGGLTDTQLRLTPVPISGTVTTGGLTDTQLRATPVPTSTAAPTTARSGQKLVAVTNTAITLSSTLAVTGVIVSALAANAGNVYVGPAAVTTANGFELQPGQATSIAIDDVAKMFVNGTAGDGVCWLAS